ELSVFPKRPARTSLAPGSPYVSGQLPPDTSRSIARSPHQSRAGSNATSGGARPLTCFEKARSIESGDGFCLRIAALSITLISYVHAIGGVRTFDRSKNPPQYKHPEYQNLQIRILALKSYSGAIQVLDTTASQLP